VVVGSSAALAVRDTKTTIPTVFFGNFDPVRLGLVTALARPGGTMTGVLIAAQGTLAAKRLELLRDAVPGATRIGVLAPDDPLFAPQLDELRRAAQRMALRSRHRGGEGGDYDRAFVALSAAKSPGAVRRRPHVLRARRRPHHRARGESTGCRRPTNGPSRPRTAG
jgi:putative ABC transport system substrate-binding protein